MRTIRYIIALLVSIAVAACKTDKIDTGLEVLDNSITLSYLSSRGDTESYESTVTDIDVLIFNENEQCVYHSHSDVEANAGKLTLSERKTAFEANKPYRVYLLANCPTELQNTLQGFKDNGKSLTDLKDAVHTTENIHLTGTNGNDTPVTFLMDGIAKLNDNASIVLNDGTTNNIDLNAVLYRAAAKIIITLKPGSNVSFLPPGGNIMYNYQLVNMRTDTRLLAEGGWATNAELKNTAMTNAHMTPPTEEKQQMQLITYTYSHDWENTSSSDNSISVVVNVPIKIEDTDYPNNYYKVPIVTDETTIERNTCYNITAEISSAGANTIPEAETLENIQYQTLDWISTPISIGDSDDQPKFLYINKENLILRNVSDDQSITFASSSDVTVKITKAYYTDKEGNTKTVPEDQYSVIPTSNLNGVLKLYSEVPTNNLIRYLTITISNQDNITKEVTVTQYPLDYIRYIIGYYSSRDELATYEAYGGRTGTANGKTIYTKDNRNIFYARVAIQESNERVIKRYKWDSSTQVTTYNEENGALTDYRMYHIQITSTSSEYVLGIPQKDEDGKVIDTKENANLVSPSFMINSQLGATDQPNNSHDDAVDYCDKYIETYQSNGVTHIYNDWRLPTDAEINIIRKYQDKEAMFAVMNGPAYWSSSGFVNIVNNPSYKATRCVRDVYEDTLPPYENSKK